MRQKLAPMLFAEEEEETFLTELRKTEKRKLLL